MRPNGAQAYATANQLCGDIVKVTPSSKMIGDFAQFMIVRYFFTQPFNISSYIFGVCLSFAS